MATKKKVDVASVNEPKLEVRKDWAAPGDLDVKGKDPRFIYRWASPHSIQKRLNEGWVIATGKEVIIAMDSQEGGQKKMRELILIKMPREMVEQRRAFYQEKTNKQLESIQRRRPPAKGELEGEGAKIETGKVASE